MPSVHLAVMERPTAGARGGLRPATRGAMEVLPVGAASEARSRNTLRLVIELANGVSHRAKGLRLVFDARPLNELKSGDLVVEERHTPREYAAARVFNDERGMMQRPSAGGMRPAHQREENGGTRNGEPQPEASR